MRDREEQREMQVCPVLLELYNAPESKSVLQHATYVH